MNELKLEPVTDGEGFIAYRTDRHSPAQMAALTFVSTGRGADILDAIRDCSRDIRAASSPNCQIARHIDAIGDQIKSLLDDIENRQA